MKRFWTSDTHYGHSNIIEYCNRPFRDCHHMNKRLIAESNMRVADGDVVVCVGDFCIRGREKYKSFLRQLNGNWVFVRGNHDKNNGVKGLCDWMFVKLSHFLIFVSHIPYYYTKPENTATSLLPYRLIEQVEEICDFAVCGHVHEKWEYSLEGKIPAINVSVDVRKFMPITDDELLKIYKGIIK